MLPFAFPLVYVAALIVRFGGKKSTAKKNKVWQKFSLSAARKYDPVALFISNILLFGLQVGESGRK